MIIGLDHITFSSNKDNNKFLLKKNYIKKFEEKKVNHFEKKKFLSLKNSFHNLVYYKSIKSNPSIEVILYKNIGNRVSNIEIKKNHILIKTNSLLQEKNLFNKIFKINPQNKNEFLFYSIIDNKTYKFRLIKERLKKYYLDSYGFISICFIVLDLKKIHRNILKNKIKCSKIFNLKINGKNINILFLRSGGNVIYELIEIKK